MLSVVIVDSHEPNVIKLTYENLWREIKNIPDAELLVTDDWVGALEKIKNTYICFVEADCLVSSGYFESQTGLFKKNSHFRRLAMLSSATAVNDWHNRFFGYELGNDYSDGVIPNTKKKANVPQAVQVGYVPGAIIRVSMLKKLLGNLDISNAWWDDLTSLSAKLSIGFWMQSDGNRVHINPNATYCSTDERINDINNVQLVQSDVDAALKKFKRECI